MNLDSYFDSCIFQLISLTSFMKVSEKAGLD